jgi:hypothetical protein
VARGKPLARAPPQCVSHRRESNPLFQGTKYPVSSPPASVELRTAIAQQTKNLLRRRCAAYCELRKSPLCHRYPAHRLVPSGRPRALGHARFRASPGIRVSRSGLKPGKQIQRACAAVGQQKTLRSIWLGRVRSKWRTVDLVSGEIAPEIIGQARAIDRPQAVRQLDVHFASAVHRVTRVVSQTLLPARARDIRPRAKTVNRFARYFFSRVQDVTQRSD